MSRWHKPHCNAPDVSVSGETPQCITCDSRCPLEEFASAQKANPPLSFPPNEPCGEMNLWWPRSVPYGISKARELSTQLIVQTSLTSHLRRKLTDSNAQLLEHDQSRSSKKPEPVEPVHLPIYGPTLGADEFRLVCIPAAGKDEDKIVHVSLETYSQANCPEYETWGGENGDYALCRPIFVGPFWDVVFQSQNCWEMLQFVRPWRGIRMVWIDALCINQSNARERGAQVAKMGKIYEQCSRVIVYLGADLVSSTHDRFPSRHLLHEIESDSIRPQLPDGCQLKNTRINLREILKRNYFNRIWVIQELIFSQRAIIRVGDLDFCADSTGSTHLKATESTNWEWDSTAAPWVQYMAQKFFPSSSIYEALRLTSQSRASDPRDRLFGVLGLIQHDGLQSQIWKADYSLSAQHVFIGLVAHFIINLKMLYLLRYAAGLSAPVSSPSWLPDWVAPESWQRIFKIPESEVEEVTNFISRNILLDPGYHLDRISVGYGCEFSQEWTDAVFQKKPWNCDISVDINTGALSINLIHLSTISFRPALIEKRGRLGIFEVKGSKTCLYLAAEGLLETVSYPGVDHLFMLVSEGSAETFFILRELDGTGSYKLIASCAVLFLVQSGWKVLKVDSLYSEVGKVRSWLDHDLPKSNDLSIPDSFWYLIGFFPGIKKFRDFIPAYRGFFNDQIGSDPNFEMSYLSCIGQEFRPRIVNGFLELSFSSSSFNDIQENYRGSLSGPDLMMPIYSWDDTSHSRPMPSVSFQNPWKWRRQQKWTQLSSEWPSDTPFMPRLYLRAPMSVVREIFELVLRPMLRIQRILGSGFDEVEALLKDGPREEQRFIGSASLELGRDLNLDISVRQVQIL